MVEVIGRLPAFGRGRRLRPRRPPPAGFARASRSRGRAASPSRGFGSKGGAPCGHRQRRADLRPALRRHPRPRARSPRALKPLTGVVEHGLFPRPGAYAALIGTPGGRRPLAPARMRGPKPPATVAAEIMSSAMGRVRLRPVRDRRGLGRRARRAHGGDDAVRVWRWPKRAAWAAPAWCAAACPRSSWSTPASSRGTVRGRARLWLDAWARPAFDWAGVQRTARDMEVARLSGIYEANLAKAGCDLIRGRATFVDRAHAGGRARGP